MEFFINEWSFGGQFFERREFERAMVMFIALIEDARKAVRYGRGRLYRSSTLRVAQAARGVHPASALNVIASAITALDVIPKSGPWIENRPAPFPS